jgi:hypothetical protein
MVFKDVEEQVKFRIEIAENLKRRASENLVKCCQR